MNTLELRKVTEDIKRNYDKTIGKLERKLDELRKEQQRAANGYLKSIFKVGFEFTGVHDGPGGGSIDFKVVAIADAGVVLAETEDNYERYIRWEQLLYAFDRYYTR